MRRLMMGVRQGRSADLEDESFVLGSRDLYRVNCQSCHGPDGHGAPPEISSLVDPVQGPSAALFIDRMKNGGSPTDQAMADHLAAQSEADVRERLLKGAKKMPPFARSRLLVPQSAVRLAEHLAKGTCHICHDPTGLGGGHMAMMAGIIPSLGGFPDQQSVDSVGRQVQYGSSGLMQMMEGPQMRAFPCLTREKAAAPYFYLLEYPPGSRTGTSRR